MSTPDDEVFQMKKIADSVNWLRQSWWSRLLGRHQKVITAVDVIAAESYEPEEDNWSSDRCRGGALWRIEHRGFTVTEDLAYDVLRACRNGDPLFITLEHLKRLDP